MCDAMLVFTKCEVRCSFFFSNGSVQEEDAEEGEGWRWRASASAI